MHQDVKAGARIAASVMILFGCAAAGAQQADLQTSATGPSAQAQVRFKMERPGLAVPTYSLEVNEDGSTRYEADEAFSGTYPPQPSFHHVDRQFTLTKATTARIFSTARALDRFTIQCESSAKNIADTGRKTLAYTGAGGDGSCAYNYSQNKQLVALTDLFEAIATTLDMGRKLDFDHRFDRLGLDAAMASLAEEVKAGRAVELGTISATLKSIANDSDLLERVRLRAEKLLESASGS